MSGEIEHSTTYFEFAWVVAGAMRCVSDSGSASASPIGRSRILLFAPTALAPGTSRTHAALAHGFGCPLPFALLPFMSSVQLHVRSPLLLPVLLAALAAAEWLADD